MMTDQLLGASLLTGTGLVFTYYTLWVIVMPFVDEDQVYIHALFPDQKFAVALPLLAGVIGLTLIGGFVAGVLLTSKSKEKTSGFVAGVLLTSKSKEKTSGFVAVVLLTSKSKEKTS